MDTSPPRQRYVITDTRYGAKPVSPPPADQLEAVSPDTKLKAEVFDALVTLTGLVLNITVTIFQVVIIGLVFSILWSWFVASYFALPVLNVPEALGLSTLLNYSLTKSPSTNQSKEKSENQLQSKEKSKPKNNPNPYKLWSDTWYQIKASFSQTLVVLILGYIFRAFLIGSLFNPF